MKRSLLLAVLGTVAVLALGSGTARADVLSNDYVDIKLGGYLKLDTYFNTNSQLNIDAPLWVNANQDMYEKDGRTFGANVRGSRLWLDVFAKNLPEEIKLKARLEIDFYGDYATSATGSRLPQPALRHYFVQLDSKYASLVAGQTWVIAAPNHPGMYHTLVLAGMGNLWQRMPQLTAKVHYDAFAGGTVNLDAGIMRPISGRDAAGVLIDNGSVGEITGMPMIQARLGLDWTMFEKKSSVGFSGSYHQEKYLYSKADSLGTGIAVGLDNGTSVTLTPADATLTSWLAALDARLAMPYTELTLEAYYGANLDSFWGTMIKYGQVSVLAKDGTTIKATNKNVEETGGFVSLKIDPVDLVTINLGFGMAKVIDPGRYRTSKDKEFLYNDGGTSRIAKAKKDAGLPMDMQMSAFGNIGFNVLKGLMIGVEEQWIRTHYLATGNADGLITNLCVKYTF